MLNNIIHPFLIFFYDNLGKFGLKQLGSGFNIRSTICFDCGEMNKTTH